MTVIALQGALNVDNFGDVLLGRIFADWVRSSGCEVVAPFASQSVYPQMLLDKPGSFSDADALLYIGGGYFGEPSRSFLGRWRWGFRMMRNHLKPAPGFLLSRKPVGVIGVGCGQISNIPARIAATTLCKMARVVAVRDDESHAFLKANGVSRTIKVTADAAVSLWDAEMSAETQAALERTRGLADGRPIVSLHLDQQSASTEQWAYMLGTLREWVERNGYYVLMITDQRNTPVVKQQLEEAQKFIVDLPFASVYRYGGVDDLFGVLSASDLIITTKLHVGIVGSTRRRPVLSIATHPKTARFFRQIGASDRCLPLWDWTPESVQQALKSVEGLVGQEVQVPTRVIEMARENRKIVMDFLTSVGGKASKASADFAGATNP
ncbi:hypothetical protein CLG96_03135 [Sphingomonas oleivorans]|uniref:Polysaccharide pyruvyl transferase domain-containing protein n=1 Tax=Sphingomonas oleivorans TaxID=1735121 RepID=A0A2T5G1U6_9SPHN|nr:polysaccharide pyruvyl transferase family protein [Sphingomonas oleivorans]PTQ13139.1 hypothetical protein CLG96_03135 [Sphingomonas oleivorans]